MNAYHVLKKIFGKSSDCVPNRLHAGSATRWDTSMAQQNVSSLCLLSTNKQDGFHMSAIKFNFKLLKFNVQYSLYISNEFLSKTLFLFDSLFSFDYS